MRKYAIFAKLEANLVSNGLSNVKIELKIEKRAVEKETWGKTRLLISNSMNFRPDYSKIVLSETQNEIHSKAIFFRY